MRRLVVLFVASFAVPAAAKGTRNGAANNATQGRPSDKTLPVDPAYQHLLDASRALAPPYASSDFRLPSAADSLIAQWRASWDRPALLKERLDAMWAAHVPEDGKVALLRVLYLGTAVEPKLQEGIERFTRVHLPAAKAAHVLEAPLAVDSVVTTTGAIEAPKTGSVPPATGSVPPATGSVPPATGTLAPTTGSVPPPTGSLPPSTGSVPPPTGSLPRASH